MPALQVKDWRRLLACAPDATSFAEKIRAFITTARLPAEIEADRNGEASHNGQPAAQEKPHSNGHPSSNGHPDAQDKLHKALQELRAALEKHL